MNWNEIWQTFCEHHPNWPEIRRQLVDDQAEFWPDLLLDGHGFSLTLVRDRQLFLKVHQQERSGAIWATMDAGTGEETWFAHDSEPLRRAYHLAMAELFSEDWVKQRQRNHRAT